MKKTTALLIVLFISLNLWAGVNVPEVAGQVIRTATITLNVGETTTYQYFNITLVDINPVSGAILVNVTGIQGSELATVEDTYVDIFGDGTIEIKTTFVSSSERQAIISVKVDVEALANVACNILSQELSDVQTNNILPANVTKEFEDNLNLAEQYKSNGWYDDSIKLAWQTLNNLRTTVKIATEAKKAILDAKSALNNPSSVSPGCQGCPLSIQLKVRDKIEKAEEYYNQGNFENALQYAQDAIQLIKDCCNSCKVFPTKKEELLKYLKTNTEGIPSDLFTAVYNKINVAQEYYNNGDCVDAISYLDDAKSLADSIITNWNKAMKCREDLLYNITQAKKDYYVVYNNSIIKIYLNAIEKKANEDLYSKIKSGYFLSAISLCQNLADELKARELKFNQTKEDMENALAHIMKIQAQGYKVDRVWAIFNEGISLMESGDYEDAQAKFMEASNTADSIKQAAIDALVAKNETTACFNQLQAEGIDVQKIFGKEINQAQSLFQEGKYTDSKNMWKVLYQKCSNPEIKNIIELRKNAHEMLGELMAMKLPLPENITSMLNQADTAFQNGNLTLAKAQYQEVISIINSIKEISNKEQETVANGKKFLKQNYKWGMNIAKWFGIPVVEERLNELSIFINQTQKAYSEGNYKVVEEDIAKINAIITDIDGDNVKNWKDPVPYIPNYYLVGLITALLLIFVNIVK